MKTTDKRVPPGRARIVEGQKGVHAGCRILVLDDDSVVRQTTAALLADCGHAVAVAESAEAALSALDRGVAVDLLLLDFSMPDMRGDEFAGRVRARRPGLPILFMSGYAGPAALDGERCVQKPFRRAELVSAVGDMLQATGSSPA